MPSVDMNSIVAERRDIYFVTLDTLRFDVAEREFRDGRLETLRTHLPHGFERRHTPGTFTYAAHHAFFAGFLPTPPRPGKHPRLFAASFRGSETTVENTFTFEEATIVGGLASRGYRTICVGGVGFFNQETALGEVFPSLFTESVWSEAMGVTDRESTRNQVKWLTARLDELDGPVFSFLNVSALHQPNYFYLDSPPADGVDTLDSHAAALRYVDRQLAPLFEAAKRRGPSFWILCGDHGTAYGEEGFHGHRLAHSSVFDVPYAHFEVNP